MSSTPTVATTPKPLCNIRILSNSVCVAGVIISLSCFLIVICNVYAKLDESVKKSPITFLNVFTGIIGFIGLPLSYAVIVGAKKIKANIHTVILLESVAFCLAICIIAAIIYFFVLLSIMKERGSEVPFLIFFLEISGFFIFICFVIYILYVQVKAENIK